MSSERDDQPRVDAPLLPGVSVADALDLLAYLVTAADLCTREPLHYGMFRLLDAAGRLSAGLEAGGGAGDRPWISQLHTDIEANKQLLMWDRPAFERFLHETAASLAGDLLADSTRALKEPDDAEH